MKNPGSILLISCYELGHQPLGVASPLGFLREAGYHPAALDLSVEPLDSEKIRNARLIGISVPMHTALRLGIRAASKIRNTNPTCHICFYGLYASLNADYLLNCGADSVIGGEYEAALLNLIGSLADGEDREIEGISRRGDIQAPALRRLSFSIPDRRLLPPLHRYARLEIDGASHLVGYTETSRGCLHRCRHCPIPPVYQGRFFVIPKEVVLEDIRRQVAAGAKHITFGDPDFLNGPGHSLAVVHAMHEEFPDLTFDITTKIEHILKYRLQFNALRRLGCLFTVSAVESLSDVVLTYLDKGHTRADVLTALAILRKERIALRPSLVPFTPWSTLEDYQDLLDFVESEILVDSIDPVQYTIRLLIPPGSLLLSLPELKPHLGPLIQESFSYRWTHPDLRMDRLWREVTEAVARAARLSQDPYQTFCRIRQRVDSVAGRQTAGTFHRPDPSRSRPPRLTESWFCCAEPTQEQIASLDKIETRI